MQNVFPRTLSQKTFRAECPGPIEDDGLMMLVTLSLAMQREALDYQQVQEAAHYLETARVGDRLTVPGLTLTRLH